MLAALEMAPRPVLLVTRAGLGAEASTALAQGGLAAAIGPDDSVEDHLSDTLAAGAGLVDAPAARAILARAPDVVAALIGHGVVFDRADDGEFARGLEAAHGRRRILHAGGDATGAVIARALVAAVRRTPSITVIEGVEARRLIVEDGRVAGLLCAAGAAALVLPAAHVVLASGGVGGLFAHGTNPPGNFGAGLALAARAGAVMADMEFVQFHPTALDGTGSPLPLISEAVRGEGAVLVDETGRPLMAGVPGGDLAPRDVVARAIAAAGAAQGRVFLDARAALGPRFATRFPTIAAELARAGLDPARDLIPVRPAAHYHMGGVATDVRGRTSIEGLHAIGEVACTGLHGANRLASNSLLEAAAMALAVAEDLRDAQTLPLRMPPVGPLPPRADAGPVRPIVSAALGLLRNGDGLASAIAALAPLAFGEGAAADPALVGLMIATAALRRRQSVGAHCRVDGDEGAIAPPRVSTLADLLAGLDVTNLVLPPTFVLQGKGEPGVAIRESPRTRVLYGSNRHSLPPCGGELERGVSN